MLTLSIFQPSSLLVRVARKSDGFMKDVPRMLSKALDIHSPQSAIPVKTKLED